MIAKKEGNTVLIKLDDGEDLMEKLTEALSLLRVRHGVILTGIGMLKDFEIGYYNGEEYEKKMHEEPHELVAMHGSVAWVDGKHDLHIHVGLAGKDHRLIGGHLLKAKVCVLNEISVLATERIEITRKHDDATGLRQMHF